MAEKAPALQFAPVPDRGMYPTIEAWADALLATLESSQVAYSAAVNYLSRRIATLEDAGGGGGAVALPFIHLTKSTTQSCGGGNGTATYITWQTQEHIDTGTFTHSTGTNPSRITVDTTGRYQLISTVGLDQDGANRTTFMLRYRINGTTTVTRGTSRGYSRGVGYADASVFLNTEVELTAGDYIEVAVLIDDTDASYTNNTLNTECEVIMRKLET